MPLIKCSECSKEISEKATSCPHCGNPIANNTKASVTVELTSKRWKLIKLFSVVGLIFGFYLFTSSYQKSGFNYPLTGLWFSLMFISAIGLFIGKFGAWWSNR
jgi:DNA-directed RNA polymerase subunit RPC12/RpoP